MRRFVIPLLFALALPLAAGEPDPYTSPDWERVLVPIVADGQFGAYGSEWHATLWMANRGEGTVHVAVPNPELVLLFPYPPIYSLNPGEAKEFPTQVTEHAGAFVAVPKTELDDVTFSFRVGDLPTWAAGLGTHIPAVRESSFRNKVVITGVRLLPLPRTTLRVYSGVDREVRVTVQTRLLLSKLVHEQSLTLTPATSMFPGFASTTIERNGEDATIEVESDGAPVWAFVSITPVTTTGSQPVFIATP
jgi:hypothetical protein